MKMNWGALTGLFKALFSKGATQLLVWAEAQMAEGAIADELPFAGWIMFGINIAISAAQMAETIVEVATSEWNIPNNIALTLTTAVTVHPDPVHGTFPVPPSGQNARCTVKLIYQNQNRPTKIDSHDVSAGFSGDTLAASFPGNTLGGQVKFEVDFTIGNWLAAKATTGWMNNDALTVKAVNLYLVEFPKPLTINSVFSHTALLVYQAGHYGWQQTATAPTATVTNTNTAPTGNAISIWAGLTLSQRANMLGLAWKAAGTGLSSCVSGADGQLYAMLNSVIPNVKQSADKFPNCGLDGQTLLVYDPYPPKFLMQNGQWVLDPVTQRPCPDPTNIQLGDYYIDPRKASNAQEADGGYHLRKVVLDNSTPFDMGADQLSYGRFPLALDSVVLHPGGYAIAVNRECKKLQITPLALNGANDADLPLARVYAGEAIVAQRPGLLFHPVAVSCSYDGTILVLEDTKSDTGNNSLILARIQAFDLRGRPVKRFFDDLGNATPFLELSTTGANTYLDLAVVGDQKMTYLYVLYYTGDGAQPSDYHLAIYQYGETAPAINPLVITDNVAAAKVAVDLWHSAYVLNWDMVTNGQGQHAGPTGGSTGLDGRTVPSVSLWVPLTS